MHRLILLAGLLSALLVSAPAGWGASQPAITIVLGDRTVMLPRSELLQRVDLTEIRVPRDSTYKQPMSYRALPLVSLLRGLPLKPDEMIEVVATDGFVTLLPPDLVFTKDNTGSVPYLAIEPVDEPWPVIPGKARQRRPLLHRLAQTGSVRRAERAVALRGCQLPQRRAAGAPLASFGRRPEAPRRLSDSCRPGFVHHAMHGVPHPERRRERPCRTGSQHPPESDRIFGTDGVATAHP